MTKCKHGNKLGEEYDICEDCIIDSQFGEEIDEEKLI